MTPEQAVEYALSEEELIEIPKKPSSGRHPVSLTRREREVAALIGQGLTNRRIAQELSISGHTVDSHVHKILKRLGLRSRTQVAAWVAKQQHLEDPARGSTINHFPGA